VSLPEQKVGRNKLAQFRHRTTVAGVFGRYTQLPELRKLVPANYVTSSLNRSLTFAVAEGLSYAESNR
jgi:hypothetical protein